MDFGRSEIAIPEHAINKNYAREITGRKIASVENAVLEIGIHDVFGFEGFFESAIGGVADHNVDCVANVCNFRKLWSESINTFLMFRLLAKLNKWLLPSLTRQKLDLAKASKLQKAIIAWRYYVTTRALEENK